MPNPVNLATLSDTLPVPVQAPPAPGYGAVDFRRLNAADVQEGVVAPGDFKATQRAAGAGAAIDVAAGQAFVQGDSVSREGLYYVGAGSPFTGATQVDVPNADAVNPRVDQLVLEVKNDVHDGSGLNLARLRVITGTPTAGATALNRIGATALPNTAVRLADFLVPAVAGGGPAVVTTANIVDRRPWARGAYRRIIRSAADYTTASATAAAIDAVNLTPRIETSGGPVRVRLRSTHLGGPTAMRYRIWQDGADIDGGNQADVALVSASIYLVDIEWETVPAAGTHLFAPAWAVQAGAGTATLKASVGAPLILLVEELVRQSADNN